MKILCVLYDDPKGGMPKSYPIKDLPKLEKYPDGMTLPSPKGRDFNPGELLGCVSGELGLRKFLESNGHELVVTNSKDGDGCEASHPSPSLLLVTTNSCPLLSKNFLNPNSPDTHPNNSPGLKSLPFGEGNVIPSGYFSNFGRSLIGYDLGIPPLGSSYNTHNIFILSPWLL